MTGFPLPKTPISLLGERVELRALSLSQVDALWTVAQDPALWVFSPEPVDSPPALTEYIRQALLSRKLNVCVPFAIWCRERERYVGSTRLMNMDAAHRRAEIGSTWLATEVQRSHINTDAKRLLLDYAFDTLLCVRVEFKCSSQNLKSRAAIARIGGVFEGTLRAHMQLPGGVRRDTCYFSILAEEWPVIRSQKPFAAS